MFRWENPPLCLYQKEIIALKELRNAFHTSDSAKCNKQEVLFPQNHTHICTQAKPSRHYIIKVDCEDFFFHFYLRNLGIEIVPLQWVTQHNIRHQQNEICNTFLFHQS